ncbi:phage scaffolding protein [Macrococcus animalis]|uniref:phage scaffolding protein n=1 Tax=Macrococcus animalis TaxID=3395467 RepID=UPI0039BE293A
MKREFLKQQGLEDEVIDEIMKEHGKTVARKEARITTLEEERDSLTTDIESRDKQIKDLKENPQIDEESKKQLETYEKENAQLKQERKDILINQAIISKIAKDVHNPETVKKLIDRDGLEVKDDGTVEGLEDKINSLKESDGYLFTTNTTIETPPTDKSTDESEQTPPLNLNPGGAQGNNGKEVDPSETGKANAKRLFNKE